MNFNGLVHNKGNKTGKTKMYLIFYIDRETYF